MKFKTLLALGAAFAAVPASATTYIGNFTSTQGGNATWSITTDNTTGLLTDSNITAWSFVLNNGTNSVTLDNTNSLFTIFGSNLSATATALNFNFGQVDPRSFVMVHAFSGLNSLICFDASNASSCTGNPSAVSFGAGTWTTNMQTLSQAGVTTIASTTGTTLVPLQNTAVPEPATWAMMVLGFGLVGSAMRQRKTTVAYA